MKDNFYNNSSYLILSTFISSALGLVFWVIAARLYSKEIVGLGTALISAATLLNSLSRLGLDQTITRYIPTGNRSRIFFSSIAITVFLGVIITVLFLVSVDFWSANLGPVNNYPIVFLIFVLLVGLDNTMTTVFVALRKGKSNFLMNALQGTRIVFLIPFAALGSVGILLSFTAGYAIGCGLCVPLIIALGIKLSKIDWKFLKESMSFSLGNHIVWVLMIGPALVLPVLVLAKLGPIQAANYYMAYTFASVAYVVPSSCTTSLFVEGSHGENLDITLRKSYKAALFLLVPVALALIIFGNYLLLLLGNDYASGGLFSLQMMVISSFPMIVFYAQISLERIGRNLMRLIMLSLVNAILLLGLSYELMSAYGLAGIGYAWIISFSISALVSLVIRKLENQGKIRFDASPRG